MIKNTEGSQSLTFKAKIMEELRKQPSVSRTVYPLDYNKNENKSDKAFNTWQDHLTAKAFEMLGLGQQLIKEANEIINSKGGK